MKINWMVMPYALLIGTLFGLFFTLQMNTFIHITKIEQQLNDQTYLIEAQYRTIREQSKKLDEALEVNNFIEIVPRQFNADIPELEMPKELL
jgi:hypothetical protein